MKKGSPNWHSTVRIEPSDAVTVLVLLVLVSIYGRAGLAVAAAAAAVFGVVSVLSGYLYGYIRVLDPYPYLRAAYVVVALFVTLVAVLVVYAMSYGEVDTFLHDAPLYLAAGTAFWGFIASSGLRGSDPLPVLPPPDSETPPAPEPPAPPSGDARRITVKKGNSLHVVETGDILYISALGDYVSIVTAGGRYIKEGTMVYYENVLADGFVRIHRSSIVNMSKISAVEQYGKQSYSVRLCNGESLRASATGYRTLKEKLNKV